MTPRIGLRRMEIVLSRMQRNREEQREVFVQSASAEEIAELEKKEKKDGSLTTVGVIISIIIVIPVMASVFILYLMHM